MKWASKKPCSSSISHGFPISLISKLKLKRETPEKESDVDEMKMAQSCTTRIRNDAGEDYHKTYQRIMEETSEIRRRFAFGSDQQQEISMKQQRRNNSNKKPRRPLCKIKAPENLKMESFAVVKHSQDPLKDFRDSMMDMITDKGINDPDSMEKLLACFLSLNDDEYHDLIIKAFRQVWCHLPHFRDLNHQLQH